MEINSKSQFENELYVQKKNLELLNLLETRCEGLENLLCKNVINIISKKIDSIEKRFSGETEIRQTVKSISVKTPDVPRVEDEKISKLNNNIKIIEKSFKDILNTSNSSTSDLINRKIEENYKLLDELERTNRPIFSKSTEINNKMYIEDKLKEMDDKLNVLFTGYNVKQAQSRNFGEAEQILRDASVNKKENGFHESPNKIAVQDRISEKQRRELENEKRKKELISQLNVTEKRIKEIAGSILKNF
jgi:hypothetical protein